MTAFGYFLSTEEYAPQQLLEQAVLAEDAGFDALWISDHFHPWNDEQGQSAFVWSMIGALSRVSRLPVMTAASRLNSSQAAGSATAASARSAGRRRALRRCAAWALPLIASMRLAPKTSMGASAETKRQATLAAASMIT